MTIRVLLVDDSAIIRGLMSKALSQDTSIEIVGAASNGEIAINMAKSTQPDIIILDIEMPVMDGIIALPHLLVVAPKCKIIMASTLTERNANISLQALSLGAADYLTKPTTKFGDDVESFYRQLTMKIHALTDGKIPVEASIVPSVQKPVVLAPIALSQESLSSAGIRAIAIASSTGGPQALMSVFEQIKGQFNHLPIFITQHMPPTFTAILADHLGKAGNRETFEAKDGLEVVEGQAYVAAGDYHMTVSESLGKVRIHTNQDPQENFCRPAADVMLRSLSAVYGKRLLLIVLTGMGQDGMLGAKEVIKNGGHVIAQDEASSVVYGMPKAVAENKLCKAILPLSNIGPYLIQQLVSR